MKCEKSDECLLNYICREGICVHKNIFPINMIEIILLFFMCLISAVATTAGVGGGAIYSAILMFFENFSASEAFPISNFIILFCSLMTFYIGVKDKFENPENKFVDYNLVVVFCPSMLLGTKLGVIMNKIFPNILLSILLIVSLALSSYKSYKNAVKQKRIEEKDKKSTQLMHKYSLEHIYNTDESEDYYDVLTAENMNNLRTAFLSRNKNGLEIINKEAEAESVDLYLENAKNPLRMDRIKYILILTFFMLIDQFIEGNEKVSSFFGVEKCTSIYWLIFILFAIFCFWFAKYTYRKIKYEEDIELYTHRNSIYSGLGYEFSITSKESEGKINKIIFICLIAGIVSGMLGVGGGIVMAPLMLELGVHPKTAASTSNFLLIFSSLVASVLFLLSGQLIWSYALMFAIPCGLSSLIGSQYINNYVSRTNKNSVLVFCLFYVMISSLIILPIDGILKAMYDIKNGNDIFAFRNYCR